jgi:hypothetical protein
LSTLSSTSTLDDVKAAYADSCSYAEDVNPAKARAFLTACHLLLLFLPRRSATSGGGQGEEIELEPRLIKEQADAARAWLAGYSSAADGGSAKYASFEDFRG